MQLGIRVLIATYGFFKLDLSDGTFRRWRPILLLLYGVIPIFLWLLGSEFSAGILMNNLGLSSLHLQADANLVANLAKLVCVFVIGLVLSLVTYYVGFISVAALVKLTYTLVAILMRLIQRTFARRSN